MTRLVLVLLAAALGTGCGLGSSDVPRGRLDLGWSFIRTAYDTSTFRYGCEAAGLDTVVVTFGRGESVRLPCANGAVEGGVVQRAPAGAQVVTLTGYRGPIALFESSFDVTIPQGGAAGYELDVFGIPEELDVYATFLNANGEYEGWSTCALAGVTTLSWSLVDFAGNLIDSAEFACTDPPGVSYRGASALDRDQYSIRMQAFGPTGTLEFDSATRLAPACEAQLFDHYGPSIANAAWDVFLYLPVPGEALCP